MLYNTIKINYQILIKILLFFSKLGILVLSNLIFVKINRILITYTFIVNLSEPKKIFMKNKIQ